MLRMAASAAELAEAGVRLFTDDGDGVQDANEPGMNNVPVTLQIQDGAGNWQVFSTTTTAADGSYSYTPAANFSGVDSVDYTVTDGSLSDVGTLTINVTAVNDAPVADDGGPYAVDESAAQNGEWTVNLDASNALVTEVRGTQCPRHPSHGSRSSSLVL